MLAYTLFEYYLETSIIPARQKQFVQENNSKKTPLHWIALPTNTKSAFTGSYFGNSFWYQQFDLRQIRLLRGSQAIVEDDSVDNYCLYGTTMIAMNFRDDILSIPIDNIKDHYVLAFDLTARQDVIDNFHYLELVEGPLRL